MSFCKAFYRDFLAFCDRVKYLVIGHWSLQCLLDANDKGQSTIIANRDMGLNSVLI
jgi:hypothetical protein